MTERSSGVISEKVIIPQSPSKSFIDKMRAIGIPESTIRRVQGK